MNDNSHILYEVWESYKDNYDYCLSAYDSLKNIIKVIRHLEKLLYIPKEEKYKTKTIFINTKLHFYSFDEFNESPSPVKLFKMENAKVKELSDYLFNIRMEASKALYRLSDLANIDLYNWGQLYKYIEENNL